MKLRCTKESLIDAINIVSKAVSARSTIAVIEGIHIKAIEGNTLRLTGNDFEIGIECVIDAQVETPGEIVVNAKMFGDIVRKLPEDAVDVELLENNLTRIKSGKSKFEIPGIVATEFPELPAFDSEYSISISKTNIKKMINNTIFSVGTSENKIVLTGCLLETLGEKIRMVAVDGYRLAMRDEKLPKEYEERSVIIPSKALSELNKILKDGDEEIEINYTQKHAVFLFDNCKMVTRLIEGEYINYRQIMPTDSGIEIKCDVRALVDSIERAALVNTSDINKSPIKMKIGGDNINISCQTSVGTVDDNLAAETGDADLEIGFNHKFLLDALHACEGEEVVLKMKAANLPCVIEPAEGNDYYYLILPVRLG
ncbi:MAG: DNA polymerase III subunit beta [Oscillospiraceae bacterium]|nr:DNA polymerase III subunit beta [Oscillospiraceae bacterium]